MKVAVKSEISKFKFWRSKKKESPSKPQENKDKKVILTKMFNLNKVFKLLDLITSSNLKTLPRNLNFFSIKYANNFLWSIN